MKGGAVVGLLRVGVSRRRVRLVWQILLLGLPDSLLVGAEDAAQVVLRVLAQVLATGELPVAEI